MDKLPTITEMHAMTHKELLRAAMDMQSEIKCLQAQLTTTAGYLEIACRPKDEAQH